MGAGTSPADPAPTGRAPDGPDPATEGGSTGPGSAAGGGSTPPGRAPEQAEPGGGATELAGPDEGAKAEGAEGGGSKAPGGAVDSATTEPERAGTGGGVDSATTAPERAGTGSGSAAADPGGASAPAPRRSRRFPLFTRDTARPEGGGRAASGDAPAPARQWPLLTVLCTAGAGLLIVALDPFAEAFRIGTILIGAALIAGAVLRWVVPSVGMLAVRSRFTDLVTYGLMGTLIVLLALVAQPKPWLDVPILEDAVRFTIR
ncbi:MULTISPECIES: DUF3017 domain-containing protein [unclassified Streptomyces]|uniref:DUF3017 domain-containing protein n=1 Tax=unclassified Streptomyces TaxID=2593676 RepID=UPI0036BF75C9